jgi:hypothetical protein
VSEDEIKAIEARANAASPGPWNYHDKHLQDPDPYGRLQFGRGEDITFVLHARTDVPRLIARVRELEAQVRDLEAARWTEST